jgi:hypothetical protein
MSNPTTGSACTAIFLPICKATDGQTVPTGAYTLSIPVQANWRTAEQGTGNNQEKQGEVERWLRIVRVLIPEGAPEWVVETVRALTPKSLGNLVCGDNKDKLCISNLRAPEGFREQ